MKKLSFKSIRIIFNYFNIRCTHFIDYPHNFSFHDLWEFRSIEWNHYSYIFPNSIFTGESKISSRILYRLKYKIFTIMMEKIGYKRF